jgi:site-specific recombinase XerD
MHVDGIYRGERIRQSLDTSSWQLAQRRLAALLAKRDQTARQTPDTNEKTLAAAVDRFLKSHGVGDRARDFRGDIEYSSFRKYRTKLSLLRTFCEREGIADLADVNLDVLEDYRRSRDVSQVTWKVELQALRTFFHYCVTHKWIAANPGTEMKSPRNLKPNKVVPYTLREEAAILDACDQIGGAKYKRGAAVYERLRAKAMILLLRHTALRISDVATLESDAVSWDEDCQRWRIFVRTLKSGEQVYLPLPDGLKVVLDVLPIPRNAPQGCRYYFWNGQSELRAVVGIAERSLAAVFKKSSVKNAHAHRYRHTLATRLLGEGEEVARHSREHRSGGQEALRQMVEEAASQHRPAHDGAFCDGTRYGASHT